MIQRTMFNTVATGASRNWARPFHELFEAQVEETPDAVALSSQEDMTYRDLNARANQIAHRLQRLGVGPESVVGVFWQRGKAMDGLLAALLGILKCGGAYLYLDATLPGQRLAFMLKDAQVSVVLTEQELNADLPVPVARTQHVCIDTDWRDLQQESRENPGSDVMLSNLAYIIYTSGSTGQPKGVCVTHRGIGNLAQAQIQACQLGPGDRVLQYFSFSFDASVSEICLALLSGASLCPVPPPALHPGPTLLRFLEEQAITVASFTPSVLSALPAAPLPALRALITGGEACHTDLVARWSAPGRRFINAYGPTECTVCASLARCEPNGQPPTIGRPISRVTMTVRDKDHLLLPDGEAGEICLGGVGLARGYTDPVLTAQRFIEDPLDPSQTLYLTGDRGCVGTDGNVVFLGRVDTQVKIRGGFRVELGEIEAVLRPQVAACAVVVCEGQLIACVVRPPGQEPAMDILRTSLKEQLPDYMIPKAIVELESLPRTSSEKVDREALLDLLPDWRSFAQDHLFRPPQTAIERQFAEIVAQTLNQNLGLTLPPRAINLQQGFAELGGDSLAVADLLLHVAAVFRVDLSEDEVNGVSLAQVAALIAEQMPGIENGA